MLKAGKSVFRRLDSVAQTQHTPLTIGFNEDRIVVDLEAADADPAVGSSHVSALAGSEGTVIDDRQAVVGRSGEAFKHQFYLGGNGGRCGDLGGWDGKQT